MNLVHENTSDRVHIVRHLGSADLLYLPGLEAEARSTLERAGLVIAPRPMGAFDEMCAGSLAAGLLFGVDSHTGCGIAGYLAASQQEDWLHIEEVAVSTSHRRRGIGTALVRHAIVECEKRRLLGCSLTTDRLLPFNLDFYLQLGFSEWIAQDGPAHLRRRITDECRVFADAERRTAMVYRCCH